MDSCEEFIKSVESADPTPCTDATELEAAGAIVPGTPSEMLMCLKQWRDSGVSLFVDGSSYTIYPLADILAHAQASTETDAFVIAADIDDAALQMARSTGALYDADGKELGMDLGQALGLLRHFALAKQIEWADGWVEKAA